MFTGMMSADTSATLNVNRLRGRRGAAELSGVIGRRLVESAALLVPRVALLCVVLASTAGAQEPTTPPPLESAPPEAVKPPPPTETKPAEDAAGWARLGGSLGFVLAAVPFALAAGYTFTSWNHVPVYPDLFLLGAGLTAPAAALVPTMGGSSATVAAELAHQPRLFRIGGWVLVVIGTLGLVTAPAYDQLFTTLGPGGPSVFGTFAAFFDASFVAGGIVSLSVAALISAKRSGETPEVVPPKNDVYQARWTPTFSVLPGPHGATASLGVGGSF
jgi:hypothetical protein